MKQFCFAAAFAAFVACGVQAQENLSSSPDQKTTTVSPQSTASTDPYELNNMATPPAFPGGEVALLHYLSQNIHYPAEAKQNNIQGNVALTFIVEKDGSISHVTVLREIGGGCAEEAARVVEGMPNWMPGMANGQPVRVRYTLPIRFRLEDTAKSEKTKKKKLRQRDSLFGN